MASIFSNFWKSPENKQTKPNLGEDLHQVMTSEDMEQYIKDSAPFLIASTASWPCVWLIRGLEWSNMRGKEGIQMYVRKTYYQAKLIQLIILSTGIFVMINKNQTHSLFAKTTREVIQTDPFALVD